MYEMSCSVRFSETERNGVMSMDGLLRLFQDVGYAHALERGFGLDYTRRTRCTWYLLSWQINAFRMPRAGEKIRLATCIYDMRASLAHKSIAMYDAGGNCLALGDTMWVYMNVDRQEPVVPENIVGDALQGGGVWLNEDFDRKIEPFGTNMSSSASRRIKMPADSTQMPPCRIEPYLLDTNGHANNVRLTEFAMRISGADNESCRGLRAEFKEQVKADSMVYPLIKKDRHDNGTVTTIAFKNDADHTMAVFEFTADAL
mgnify:CR=1 FL=1